MGHDGRGKLSPMAIKLWRFLVVLILIAILATVLVSQVTKDDQAWQATLAIGLKNTLSTGITQLYWQWQDKGRPSRIVYQPEHVNTTVEIDVSTSGRALFEPSDEGCATFLYWFVEQEVLENHINTSIKKYEDTDTKNVEVVCEYRLYQFVFLYFAETGELQMTRVE
ncbi:hypothetical protein ACOI22_13420 [Glaciecola sp. 2405UD65-10]|uniref:hypothetical protein n=1 Tax=Glaciecola sp. 2405UD65-10 TaxID=3397244 RepID=UPI003B5B093A